MTILVLANSRRTVHDRFELNVKNMYILELHVRKIQFRAKYRLNDQFRSYIILLEAMLRKYIDDKTKRGFVER